MLKKIKEYYELTKLKDTGEDLEEDVPITWIKVFHKNYPRFPSIILPKVQEKDSQFETLIEMRESTRNFSETAVSLEEISKILKVNRIVDSHREPERRTYPSGGARFPVEIYLVSYNIEDLEKGAFHYDIQRERLEKLLVEDLTPKRRELISPYLENPAGTFIFTSVIPRSEVKYSYKSYPFSFIEAGHMGQNIVLKCAEIGIGVCPVSGFIDDTVKEILDLTENEIPIYTLSFGKRKLL